MKHARGRKSFAVPQRKHQLSQIDLLARLEIVGYSRK